MSPALADEARETLERGLAQVLGSESDNRLDAMTDMLKVVSANVVVRPSGREFLVQGNDSILQAGLKAGLGLNYGCAGGNCGLCKARVISGETRQILHSDYSLSAAERTQGYLLLAGDTVCFARHIHKKRKCTFSEACLAAFITDCARLPANMF